MNAHTTAKTYAKCLSELMSFIDGVHYDATASFTRDELLAITADQVAAYLNKKAYGTPSPSPDDRPHHMRAASLAYHKKAISQFMPLRIMAWDDINLRGNPTRSTAVNDVITRVKKYEVRQEGVSSKARRALEWEEFYSLLWLVRHLYATVDLWYYLTAVLCLQWQIIGRIDDVMKLGKGTLLFNTCEPAALSVKMNWSKNIREERDCPIQILFGAMDPLVCPLLNLAIWLEGGFMVYSCLVNTNLTDQWQVCLTQSLPTKSSLRFGGASLALTPFGRGLLLMQLASVYARIGSLPVDAGGVISNKLIPTSK